MSRFEAAGVRRLADCRLFVFDLDGTLYAETHHFEYYGNELARRLPQTAADAFRADVARALALEHPLRYGRLYDVLRRIVREGERAYDWSGQEVEAQPVAPDDVLMHVHDPWWVYAATAAYHGLDPQGTHEAFMATRAYMEGALFPMSPLSGLAEALARLAAAGRAFVLATNSPEPDSRAIIDKLGLTGRFADSIFLARKPHHMREQFASWKDRFQVPYEQTASVGDNYRNEIEPAIALGMQTVYIDRYLAQAREEVTVQLHSPDELGDLFSTIATTVEGR